MAPSGGGGTTGLQAEVISILLFLLLATLQQTVQVRLVSLRLRLLIDQINEWWVGSKLNQNESQDEIS